MVVWGEAGDALQLLAVGSVQPADRPCHSIVSALPRYAASDPAVVTQLLDSHAFEKFVESISKVRVRVCASAAAWCGLGLAVARLDGLGWSARPSPPSSSLITHKIHHKLPTNFTPQLHTPKVAELHGDIPASSLVEMYVALMKFTEQVYPERLDNTNRVLGAAYAALSTKVRLGSGGKRGREGS